MEQYIETHARTHGKRYAQKPAKRKQKNNKFKKFLIKYILFLIVLMVIFLMYVINSLKTYEKLEVNNFLNSALQKVAEAGERGKVPEYVDISGLKLSKFEKEDTNKDKLVGKMLKESEFTFKLDSESVDLNNPVYNVYSNDELLFKVKLNGEKKVTRLAILTFQDWKVDSIKLAKTNGLYECSIEVPSNLKVSVNGTELTEDEKDEGKQNEGLKEISKYVQIPYLIKYKIDGLIAEPEIEIKDEDGNKVEYEKEGNAYKVSLNNNEKIEDKDEALAKIKGKVNIEKIAKDWSLYLSNDLPGRLHGFYNISEYLIKDSYMWKYAYKWATNVDITFISKHTLANPTFTKVKLNNFTIYSDDAFSCEIYLQKNLLLTNASRKKIEDVMNERMYFAYYNGEWKLVNMESITNNK